MMQKKKCCCGGSPPLPGCVCDLIGLVPQPWPDPLAALCALHQPGIDKLNPVRGIYISQGNLVEEWEVQPTHVESFSEWIGFPESCNIIVSQPGMPMLRFAGSTSMHRVNGIEVGPTPVSWNIRPNAQGLYYIDGSEMPFLSTSTTEPYLIIPPGGGFGCQFLDSGLNGGSGIGEIVQAFTTNQDGILFQADCPPPCECEVHRGACNASVACSLAANAAATMEVSASYVSGANTQTFSGTISQQKNCSALCGAGSFPTVLSFSGNLDFVTNGVPQTVFKTIAVRWLTGNFDGLLAGQFAIINFAGSGGWPVTFDTVSIGLGNPSGPATAPCSFSASYNESGGGAESTGSVLIKTNCS